MKTVTVLMSTYNGERYLRDQIESIIGQKKVNLSIIVRDDGSIDGTKRILEDYQNTDVLSWYTGVNLGPAKSFLDIMKNAPQSDYYAFSDQDDIWDENKISNAINKIEELGDESEPLLYCGNYQLVDEKLNPLQENGHFSTTSFEAAVVASNCTGCTTLFNRKLLEMVNCGEPDIIVMHDDWIHKVCLAVGGRVVYDDKKYIKYRQHGNNVDGGIHSRFHKIIQIIARIKSKDCIRSRQIEELGRIYGNVMPEKNLLLCKTIGKQKKTIRDKISIITSGSIGTDNRKINSAFKIAICLGYY